MVANVADNSDLDIDDEELERHYAVQMRLLDEAHAYAHAHQAAKDRSRSEEVACRDRRHPGEVVGA